MKRLLSLMLALVLVLGMVTVTALPAAATPEENTATESVQTVTEPEETEPEASQPEETEPEETEPEETEPESTGFKASDELIALLKYEEGFCRYPVWDYSQYTVGYGTRCPSDKVAYYKANGITEQEAERLLRNHLVNTENLINVKLIEKYGLEMTQGQFDALVMFSYNMGGSWITDKSSNIHQVVASGADDNVIVDALSRWCKAGGSVQSFLVRRRLSESYMYLEGKYAHTPPDYYCYVRYSGNGGSTSQSVQGFNANMYAAPACVATYGDYTFAGWYTDPTGGEKVEKLTKDLDKTTLYAHWEEIKYEEPELFDEPIRVKVTTNDLNLRKGPGTNYARIGSADKGDEFEIWQVQQGGSYNWGYYKTGWICLQYTNYDQVISGEPELSPEPTEPAPTEPEVTVPEETEPEETKPAKITGVVNADPYLCVRSGPGTGYPTVNTLRNGAKVEITEQKTVGSMIWGKTSAGWVSMSYITVDEEFESEKDPNTTTGQTGTVTCSQLNARTGAGINYGISGYYYKNNKVTITEQKTVGSTTWGKTAKGWVSMDYIKLDSTGSTGSEGNSGSGNTGSTGYTGVVTSSDVLRIRSGAGSSYSVVGYLNPKEKVTILEQKTVGATTWGKIAKGWVSMDYIKLDSTGSEGSEGNTGSGNTGSTGTTGTVTSSNVLRIRSGAGSSYSVVGYFNPKEKVTILEQKTVGSVTWGRTEKGWVSMEYIKLDSTANEDTLPEVDLEGNKPETMVKTVNVGNLNIRKDAGTQYSVVGYLTRGAKVTVTETKTVGGQLWGKISTGWICLEYTV